MLEKSENWGGGTRLKQSLRQLLDHHAGVLTGRTTVIILSDLKTERLDWCADSFAEIGRRVKRVYIFRAVDGRDYAEIAPEFRREVDILSQSVDRIFTVSSLNDMAKAVRGLILK